ncbi:Ig domain-containing protein [Leptospira perdikensis]|uniref:Lipoprotein n=1 Tax=Leptospira perdikensis TaxID=2484948 RepID=A0A4V3JN52_9LEPT|nr:Ig domain-containing protein [Leptospira perdikensis]TGL33515.1 hypothetical protein EHQ49_17970 [Leptospira perdikensis]
MAKKNIFPITLKDCSLVLIFLFTLSCFTKEAHQSGSWVTHLLGIVSTFTAEKKMPDSSDSTLEGSYSVRSVAPNVVLENSQFLIEGENLRHLTVGQLFGEGFEKFLEFTEVTESKIIVSLFRCPDSSLVLRSSPNQENNHPISIPCLGSFDYSVRTLKLDLGQPFSPVIPIFSTNVWEILQTLGEVEFVSSPPLPVGIHLHPDTGEIKGMPTISTENQFRSYTVVARLKKNPETKLSSSVQLIVLSEEDKKSRICKSIAETSICRGSTPHSCANSSVCFISQFACETDLKCGF